MDHYVLFLAVIAGIAVLLVLILYFKIHAFIALFISSIIVGIIAGMPPVDIIVNLQKGMGDTLGFVAAVVGLGAMFGALLEHSGGAQVLAAYLLKKTGENNASWAMSFTGLVIAIPVFFDVAFIILVPLIFALQKRTGKSLLLYGIPLLAGLAVGHSFIPPTPGPVAVAEILGADLGWVIVTGMLAGIPAVVIAGPVFGRFIAGKIKSTSSLYDEPLSLPVNLPSAGLIFSMIGIPIALIIVNSVVNSPLGVALNIPPRSKEWLRLIGHPFSALILANLIAWYFLGLRKGYSKEKLMEVTGRSLAPAGVIILITGAGGMFKQILTETGAGKMLAEAMTDSGISYILFAFLIAALVRILQGSSTVAMITAAGMTASLTAELSLGNLEKALIVTSIASGATILSHVNDSGFWLVSRYFGLNEKQTLASWSVVTTLIAFTGLIMVLLIKITFT